MAGWMVWMALVVDAGAADADRDAQSTQDLWVSMSMLEVEPELLRRLEEPLQIRQGPATIELLDGYLVPVFSGEFAEAWAREAPEILRAQRERGQAPRVPTADERGNRELVGFVWVGGTGTMTVQFPDRADGLVLSNRLVSALGVPRAELEPVVRAGEPFVTSVTEGVMLGVDPLLEHTFRGPQDIDPYEIVVYGDSAAAARRRARTVWRQRTDVWNALDLDVADRIAWDRVAGMRGTTSALGSFALSDLSTAHRYGYVVEPGSAAPPEDDRWLAAVTDTTGRFDPRRSVRVASLGISPRGLSVDGLVSGLPNPPVDPDDPTSARMPVVRPVPVRADTRIYARPSSSRLVYEVDVQSHLTVRAEGGELPWLDLLVPMRHPGTWRIVAAALPDGTNLLGVDPDSSGLVRRPGPREDLERQDSSRDVVVTPGTSTMGPSLTWRSEREGAMDPNDPEILLETPPQQRLVRLLLPEPLAPGEEQTVRLRYIDRWAGSHKTSDVQRVLPQLVPGPVGQGWPFTTRVAVPDDSPIVVAASGATQRTWVDEQGWRWIEVGSGETPARWAEVAVGRFKTVLEPSRQGFPAVRTVLRTTHWGQIEEFAPETRRVLDYYQRWLPPFPYPEIDIVEAPRSGSFGWLGAHGMVDLQVKKSTAVVGASIEDNHYAHRLFAHRLAHLYFGHLAPPASTEDSWVAETFSEMLSCMYVGAAFDPSDCADVMKDKREYWEQRDPGPLVAGSLTRAWTEWRHPEIVRDYGPYVFAEMLRPRLGNESFFAALDLLLTEHPHEPLTTERLQHYFEGTSGQDLSAFFDFWVHSGLVPRLELEWTTVGGEVVGQVTSDVPFGTFDVQVRVQDRKGRRGEEPAEVWVTVDVVDGVGHFTVLQPGPAERLVVDLDPNHRTLSRSRRVRRDAAMELVRGEE